MFKITGTKFANWSREVDSERHLSHWASRATSWMLFHVVNAINPFKPNVCNSVGPIQLHVINSIPRLAGFIGGSETAKCHRFRNCIDHMIICWLLIGLERSRNFPERALPVIACQWMYTVNNGNFIQPIKAQVLTNQTLETLLVSSALKRGKNRYVQKDCHFCCAQISDFHSLIA